MALFGKKTMVSPDGYERKTVRGYADKGPVAKLLCEGWEIESATPVMVKGCTMKQMIFLLKRAA